MLLYDQSQMALILWRSKVQVPPDAGMPNRLFFGSLSTFSEDFIEIRSQIFRLFLLRQVNVDSYHMTSLAEVIIARCVLDSHLLRQLLCRETAEQVVGSVYLNRTHPILVFICRYASFRWFWTKEVCFPAWFALSFSLLYAIIKLFTCPV